MAVELTPVLPLLVRFLVSTATAAGAQADRAPETGEAEPNRTELDLIPAVSFSTDTGLGLGIIGVLARIEEGKNPFAWRIQALVFASIREVAGTWELPLQAHIVQLDVPGFLDPRLRLNASVAFRRQSNARWFGQGSRTSDEAPEGSGGRFFLYDRISPGLGGRLRWAVVDRPVKVGKWRLELFGGFDISYVDIQTYDGSLLAVELGADPENADLPGGGEHGLLVGVTGLLFDTRDNEFVPARGSFAELSIRGSPGIDQDLNYVGFFASYAYYLALGSRHFVLAGQLAGDFLEGTVPFYELSRMGGFQPFDAPGGGGAVRGLVQSRFAGEAKVIGHLEFRAQDWAPFGSQQGFFLGAVAFFDTGRVISTAEMISERDPLGLDVGVGGGLRLRLGNTLVVRFDLGYALPDETVGFYVDVGQVF